MNLRGKEFPSFFTLIKKFPADRPKVAHLNSRFRVEYKTDAVNDYFSRSKDPGVFRAFIDGVESEDASINLWNGNAYLNVFINEGNEGDVLAVRSEVVDVSRNIPLIEEFYVRIEGPLSKHASSPGSRKPPSSNRPGKGSVAPDGFALPNIVEVTRDGRSGHSWDEQGFNSSSALKVKGSDADGFDFFVNLDNLNLLTELKAYQQIDVKSVEAKYKFGLVLVGLALLQDKSFMEVKNEDEDVDVFDAIYKTTKAISSIIIPMIDGLSSLTTEDIVAIEEE